MCQGASALMTQRPPSASELCDFHRVGEGELRDGQSINSRLVFYLDVLVAPLARYSCLIRGLRASSAVPFLGVTAIADAPLSCGLRLSAEG